MMADVYGKNIARGKADPRRMLLVGRLTMIIATVLGIVFASFSLDILVMLVFVGALWGAIVFPVIASCFWDRITNLAFTSSVLVAMVVFCMARFEWVPLEGISGLIFELLASIGGGVIIGLMVFGFLGRIAGLVAGVLAMLAMVVFATGELRDYTVLLASLTAYGTSTLVCVIMSLASRQPRFDFTTITDKVGHYDESLT